ncbi:FAD-dependent oxidoreductase [Paenibacillus filicis]|uniref:FAD-dependent oxidoreductase n=1 Tax=Paenibacillus gyeongsangnamensis TaxID=3388067 RepID=A0ABT4QJS5_9BACL|nr:FAD-dependent oxidoreductase [Paenibacillus filicis]MCZ8516951.1 FAD-dependent oxidoreductase [Paenibacillus filicis]
MKTLLLVGGGHAHLHILKQLQTGALPGVRTILISPSEFQYYSGMLSGYIEGVYRLDEIRLSLDHLTRRAGIEWMKDRAVSVDPARQTVLTEQGTTVRYDVVSFDIGSLTAHTEITGVAEHAVMIKPYDAVAEIVEKIDRAEQIVVAGGGASGVEVSLAIQARRSKSGKLTPVSLISAGGLLSKSGPAFSRKITEIVQGKGIHLCTNDPVTDLTANRVRLKSGSLPFDQLLWLAGPRAPAIFSRSEVADKAGYLLLNSKLQSVFYPNIFGAGDCVTIDEHPGLDKAGVYAVREAPILWNNLKQFLNDGQLARYKPQRSYLSILSTGGQEGLLLYKGLAFHGGWCWKLKREIDKAFMDNYR